MRNENLKKNLRTSVIVFVCALMFAPTFAADMRVVSTTGETFEITKAKLQNGKRLNVVCGDARMEIPFRNVETMLIDQAQITSVNGEVHFGVEIKLRESETVIGNIKERGRCLIPSNNGLRGRIEKVSYRAPFSGIASMQLIVEEAETQADSDEEDED